MAPAGSFRDDMRLLLHEKLLDAARDITTAEGWSALTMGAVASRAGISRQHLYNEIGTKRALGDALVGRETDEFLAGMCERLRAHPTDLLAGIGAAVRQALDHGSRNALLKAILAADDVRGDSLLPLLTARPDAVLTRAKQALRAEVAAVHPDHGQGAADLEVCIDGVVRLVLSHLTQPTGPAEHAIAQAQGLTRGVMADG
jgi:AcrR family transcriptional regulator